MRLLTAVVGLVLLGCGSPTPEPSPETPAADQAPALELADLPQGAIFLSSVQGTDTSPRIVLQAVTPTGERFEVLDTPIEPALVRESMALEASALVGPTGFLAAGFNDGSGRHVLRVYDLADRADPFVGEEIVSGPAGFAWGPHGMLSFGPAEDDGIRAILDPSDGATKTVELPSDAAVYRTWTADGAGWLAVAPADRVGAERLGVVSARDGSFRPAEAPPEPFVGSHQELREFDRAGERLHWIAAFDDMGKGDSPSQIISAPLGQEPAFDGGVGTVWKDSRLDGQPWIWHGWDVDGDGVLAVAASEVGLELVRLDRQGLRSRRVAVIHRDAAAESALVLSVWAAGHPVRPDVLLHLGDRDELAWYSGSADQTITLRASADPPAYFAGWRGSLWDPSRD